RRALAAVERGDAAELARLAQTMRTAAGRKEAGAAAADAAGHLETPAVISQPYPEACIAPARALGVEPVEVRQPSRDFTARIRASRETYAWAASAATLALAHEGVAQLRASLDSLPAIEDSNADVLAETVSLFALHVFINSAGIRYLPMLSERELVLLE